MVISKKHGLVYLPNTVDKNKWAELLRMSILGELHNRCPAPQPVYDIEYILREELLLCDDDRDTAKSIIENLQMALRPLHDRHGPWMRYNLTTVNEDFYVIAVGDHRILEWEAGRGRSDRSVTEFEETEFEKAVGVSWGVCEPAQKETATISPNYGFFNTVDIREHTVLNAPGHPTLKPPSAMSHETWSTLQLSGGETLQAQTAVKIVANWYDVGICNMPVEAGTILRCFCRDEDGVSVGYINRAE